MTNPKDPTATQVVRMLLASCKELLEECGKKRAGDWAIINDGMVAGEEFARKSETRTNAVENFLLNYGGVATLILNTTFDADGHKWVRSIEDMDEPMDILWWCAWCGTHRSEVDNWKDNPACPAVAAAKALVPIFGATNG